MDALAPPCDLRVGGPRNLYFMGFQMTVKSAEVSLAALCSVCVWGFCMRNARGRPEVTSQDE